MAGIFERFHHRLGGSPADRARGGASESVEPSAEDLALRLSSMPGYRVLREIDANAGVERLRATTAGERIAAVVDTETTGLDLANDRIIEIAVQRVIFDVGQHIVEIERVRSWLEDPQRPLTTDISRLTGLVDRDLVGQRFDEEAILELVGAADIVIAHNAAFDRPFIDRRFPSLADFPWACSLSQLDWRELGYDGRALGYLVLQSGRFFDGHRAGNDTSALVTLLGTLAADGRTILAHLLDRCERGSHRLEAIGAPFEAKDGLKSRGYSWDAARRHWWREVETSELSCEEEWLEREVYRGRGRPRSIPITPKTRFKREC
jgi:DNA polymerase III subunit epsilon